MKITLSSSSSSFSLLLSLWWPLSSFIVIVFVIIIIVEGLNEPSSHFKSRQLWRCYDSDYTVHQRHLWNYCTYITTLQYRVALKPITTLRRLLTNVKDKAKPEDRQGAVYKIKCCDCQASHIGETGRNLSTRLNEHKRATRNGDVNYHIAEHHLQTKHQIDWDSETCITYSTDYSQRLTLESWFTNLEQTQLNRSQQLPAPYKRLIDEIKQN